MKFEFNLEELDFIVNREFPSFGNVDVCASKYFSEHYENHVRKLGLRLQKGEPSALLTGKGSMGVHKDEVVGYSLLTLIHCHWPHDQDSRPQYHDNNGQFFYDGNMFDMNIGDSIIFNDCEDHAWLCNGYWTFMSASIDDEWVRNTIPKKYIGTLLNEEELMNTLCQL